MDLWIPEYPRHDAVGDLPADVTCHTFAPEAPVPSEALAAEFFVPSHRTPGLDESVPRMTQLRVLPGLPCRRSPARQNTPDALPVPTRQCLHLPLPTLQSIDLPPTYV